jgi:hypothetical protein
MKARYVASDAPLRTTVEDAKKGKLKKLVHEVLPGVCLDTELALWKDFLHVIKCESMMSFDTEGTIPPITSVYGSGHGVVFIFHCPEDLPSELRNLIEDDSILKIQVAALEDKVRLHSKVHVNAEVDIGNLMKMFMSTTESFGGSFLADLQNEHKIPFYTSHKDHCQFNTAKPLDPKSLAHCVQDVRAPFAGLYHLVEKLCIDFKVAENANILPITNYILTRYLSAKFSVMF